MKFQLYSDLHLEFHRDDGEAFVKALPVLTDTVVLAGDIVTPSCAASLRFFAERWKHVVYVRGNHEAWKSSYPRLLRTRVSPGVNLLEQSAITFEDQRFLGATLWFPNLRALNLYPPEVVQRLENFMVDFKVIRDFVPLVYSNHEATKVWLRQTIEPSDVVVTHHIPHKRAIHPKYAGEPTNAFFLGAVDHILEEKQPKIWVFGHTHESFDFRIGATRIVSNPFGYFNHEVNLAFKEDLVIDTDTDTDGVDV